MHRKILSMSMMFLLIAVAAFAAGGEEKTIQPVSPAEGKPSAPPGPSYFEGTWVGKWPGHRGPATDQDVTVTIEKGKKDGFYAVTYGWGTVNYLGGSVPGGSLKTRGRQEGDKFFFGWKNKLGRDFKVTLQEYKEKVAKARIDRGGPLGPGELLPFSESYLDRK